MRLIEKSFTNNLYKTLKESSNDAAQAVYDVFDGTDFFVNEVYSVGDGLVKFNVTAFDAEGNELTRDVEVDIPNDDYYDVKQDSYEAVYTCVENWREEHDSPDTFYEGVMINTGSTTITSDETGVTVEDNGNTITTGNGVTVDVDNTDDVLPAEMDIAAPVEELPIEEPVEEIPVEEIPAEDIQTDETAEEDEEELTEAIEKDGGPFPYLMKHGQGPGTLPDGVNIVKYGESNNGKDIVYLDKVLTPEEEAEFEMKPMAKLEDCEDKPINEADGISNNQNIEIFQNDEFDYEILDITELDNVDSGDVRAIDMQSILASLDESLTERFGDENWGVLNSFITRKGTHKKTNESYSSAILELSLPRLNESVGAFNTVLMLEVYGDKAVKECVTRDSKSKAISRFCGKSKNPVKHFESVILDIMNQRTLEEAVEVMVNEPEREENLNFADSKAIDKDIERQENHLKQHDKKHKEVKKFKLELEPDQDNTAGKTEEEATDTAKVEKLPKAKKTKVNAEKIAKPKKLKESAEGNQEFWNTGITVGQTIESDGAGTVEVLDVDQASNYILIKRNTGYQPFIAAWCPEMYNGKLVWGQGHYFTDENDAREYFEDKKLNESVIKEREEIDPDYRPNADFKHIDDVWEALDACKSKEEIQAIIDTIPEKFGSFVIEDNGDHITVVNNYEEYNDVQEDRQDFYFESVVKEAEELPIEDEDTLDEEGSATAIFHRKPASVSAMKAAEANGITVNKSNYKVINTKDLEPFEFEDFANHLASKNYPWLEELYTSEESNSGMFRCIEVVNTADNSYSILVDPSGYDYARYAAIKGNPEGEESSELLAEPEELISEE